MMYTPNKKKSRLSDAMPEGFDIADIVQFYPSDPNPKSHNHDKQNIAKHALIEIGQLEYGTVSDRTPQKKCVPLTIDSWVAAPLKIKTPTRVPKLCPTNLNTKRNFRSVTATLLKYRNEENTVSKLKEELRKLESPENPKTEKKMGDSKTEMRESLLSKRRPETRVGDLIRLKESEQSRVHGSTPASFNLRKISTSMENKGEGRSRKEYPIPPDPLSMKEICQAYNYSYKQQRRNRTLRNILN